MPRRLSFQLYSARNQPIDETLAMLAGIGYRDVEGYGGVYDDPAGLRASLDRLGLAMPTGHFGIDMLESDRARVISLCAAFGIGHVYAPYLSAEQRPTTAAGWRKLGKRLATIGEWVRGEGNGFGWHNHDFEFQRLASGEIPLDVLFDAAPMLDWERDVAWIARAGANPLSWVKKYAGRITAVHIKDLAAKGEARDEDGWADPGKGTVAWSTIFKALKSSRAMHFIVEHDNPSSVERFARNAFAYAGSA